MWIHVLAAFETAFIKLFLLKSTALCVCVQMYTAYLRYFIIHYLLDIFHSHLIFYIVSPKFYAFVFYYTK